MQSEDVAQCSAVQRGQQGREGGRRPAKMDKLSHTQISDRLSQTYGDSPNKRLHHLSSLSGRALPFSPLWPLSLSLDLREGNGQSRASADAVHTRTQVANKKARQVVFKRAEQYVNEYRKKEREEIRLRRVAKNSGEFYVPAQPKVYFVIRLRG